MQAVVIYDSQFGNTERIAKTIAQGLEEQASVAVLPVSDALEQAPERPDMLLVGGPTQRHGMSSPLSAFLEGLAPDQLGAACVATFDTRYRMTTLLAGSAATQAAGRLRRAGCRLVAPPESFFIERDRPPRGEKRRHEIEHLEPGELERAREWGRALVAATAPD